MNCLNCGAPIPEGVRFCANCGAKIPSEAAQPTPVPTPTPTPTPNPTPVPGMGAQPSQPGMPQQFAAPPEQPPKKKKIGLIVLILVLVVVVAAAAAVAVFFLTKDKDSDDEEKGNTPEEAFTVEYEALVSGDADTFYDCIPQDCWDTLLDEYNIDAEIFQDYFDNYIDMLVENFEDSYGENLKVTIENFKADDSYDKDDLADLNEELEEYGLTAEDAREYTAALAIEGDDDSYTEDEEGIMIQIDGTWYDMGMLYIAEYGVEYHDSNY